MNGNLVMLSVDSVILAMLTAAYFLAQPGWVSGGLFGLALVGVAGILPMLRRRAPRAEDW